MKLVILRSEKSGREIGPDDHYLQQFTTHYADRLIGNLHGEPDFCSACAEDCIRCRDPYRLDFSRDIAAIISFPDVLPHVLEHPSEYVPADVPPHDILLALHIHEQILLEFIQQCGQWGTKGVVAPLEAPHWISQAARRKAYAISEAVNLEIEFPKPMCAFKPPSGSALDAFRHHFRIGYPEVDLVVKDGTITRADVKSSAACGSTYYIARWLVGRKINEDLATEVISKRLHSYPCTASMERDPELCDDTALHIAGQAHNKILAPVMRIPATPAHDQILSPLGTWVQRAVSPTDSLKTIEEAKEVILSHRRQHPQATMEELRAAATTTLPPALVVSALLLLKKEGKL